MNILPYSPIPGHHRAFAYVPAERTNIAETFARFRKEHTADDLVPARKPHTVGDDYDDCERSHHLDFIGGFK